jgi:2-keto-4-pentenoate hydratase
MRVPFLYLLSALAFEICAVEPPSPEMIKGAAQNYLAKKPVSGIEKGFSIDDAYKAQDTFTKLLAKKMGERTGYKIGLITKSGQERLGANGPIRGVLLKEMLLENGAKVSAAYGLKPAVELDMGVYVKDEAINDAKSLPEIIPHLSSLVCFIELVDTIAGTNQPMDASVLVSLNVGARAGIVGEKVPMTGPIANALLNMKMVLSDEGGKILAEVPKLDLQPLTNIPMLAASLKKEGKRLKAGDFISLGSPAAPQPVPVGKTIRLRYENLPSGPLTATVVFQP